VTALAMLAIVHERDMEKIEANNQAWIDYLQQYDFADYEYVQDGKGVNVMGNGNGVEIHGSESENQNQDSTEPEPGSR
jgi:primase-polymerase (primpol)-like protein